MRGNEQRLEHVPFISDPTYACIYLEKGSFGGPPVRRHLEQPGISPAVGNQAQSIPADAKGIPLRPAEPQPTGRPVSKKLTFVVVSH